MYRPVERFSVGIETSTSGLVEQRHSGHSRLARPLLAALPIAVLIGAGQWLEDRLGLDGGLLDAGAGVLATLFALVMLRFHPARELLASLAGLVTVALMLLIETGVLDLIPLP